MKTEKIAVFITVVIVFLIGIVTGLLGLMSWGFALNGFPAGYAVVDISLYVYLGLAVISLILMSILSGSIAKKLIALNWTAFTGSAISALIFSILIAIAHSLSFAISMIIANSTL